MTTHDNLERLRRSLDRDRSLPAAHRLIKMLRFGAATATGPLYLLGCDRVGPGARTRGRPMISNAGRIEIGARAHLGSTFTPIHLSTSPGGRIEIGDDAAINFGCSISAESAVTLGHRVSLGPYVVISDTDGEPNGERGPKPIRIGDDVWLAARVRVHRGATIGDGSVIIAGSEVTGDIPPGVIAGGAPARPLRRKRADESAHEIARENEPDVAHAAGVEHGARGALRRLHASASRGLARLALLGVDRLGANPRVHGRPFVENLGRITIGDDFELESLPVQSHLVTGPAGIIAIGDGVRIAEGAAISAEARVEIGDCARLGPFAMILDSDYHAAGDRSARGAAAPIVIGAYAWLGERVTVLRGATIGAFARIEAGSVVTGAIPEGARAAGVPARVVHRSAEAARESVERQSAH